MEVAEVATALVGSYLAHLGSGLLQRVEGTAIDRLYAYVSDRLRATTVGANLMERLEEQPNDPERQAAVRAVLGDRIAADETFGRELAALVQEAQASPPQKQTTNFNNSGGFRMGRRATFAQGSVDQAQKTFRSGGRGSGLALLAVIVLLLVVGTSAYFMLGDSGGDTKDAVARGKNQATSAGRAPARTTTFADAAENLSRVAASTGPVICTQSGNYWEATSFDDTLQKRLVTVSEQAFGDRLNEIARETLGESASVRDPCEEAGVSPISSDGERVAVQVDSVEGNTEYHVGWLDSKSGKFTDITEKSNKTGYVSQRFSDENPGFAPDGSFWFLRGSRFMSADIQGRLSSHKASLACSTGKHEELFYRPVKSAAVLCPQTIHPSGKFAASPTRVAQGFTLVDGFELEVLASKLDELDDAPIHAPLWMQVVVRDHGELRGCSPVAWVNSDDLLCFGPDHDFFTVEVDPAAARSDLDYLQTTYVEVKKILTPKTGSAIVSFAVSHDRQSLLILAREEGAGSRTMAYRASLTEPGNPVELGPAPAGDNLTLRGNFQMIGWE